MSYSRFSRRLSAFAIVTFLTYLWSLSVSFVDALRQPKVLPYWGATLSAVSLGFIFLGLLMTACRIYVDLWAVEDDQIFEKSILALAPGKRYLELTLRVGIVWLIHLWPHVFRSIGSASFSEITLFAAAVCVAVWNLLVWPARAAAWNQRSQATRDINTRRKMWHGLDWLYVCVTGYHLGTSAILSRILSPVDFAVFAGGVPALYVAAFVVGVWIRGSEYRQILIRERTI